MNNLQEKEIKTLFDAGALKAATVAPNPDGKGGWIALFAGEKNYALRSQRDTITRNFKTLDAAQKTLKAIGFREFRVSYK